MLLLRHKRIVLLLPFFHHKYIISMWVSEEIKYVHTVQISNQAYFYHNNITNFCHTIKTVLALLYWHRTFHFTVSMTFSHLGYDSYIKSSLLLSYYLLFSLFRSWDVSDVGRFIFSLYMCRVILNLRNPSK